MDLSERRDLLNGFGDGLARAVELAVTPTVFGALGYALDRWVGVVPLFTIALLVFALCGMFVRVWFEYDQRMRRLEQEGPWRRAPVLGAGAPAAAGGDPEAGG